MVDLNECSINNGGCEQICVDTVGSFMCKCNSTSELKEDGKSCQSGNVFFDSKWKYIINDD